MGYSTPPSIPTRIIETPKKANTNGDVIDGRAALRRQSAERDHHQHAEHRQQVEERVRHEVVELGAQVFGVEPAARPRQAVHFCCVTRRQGRDAHERDAGEDDAAHRLAAAERDRHQLGGDADRREARTRT